MVNKSIKILKLIVPIMFIVFYIVSLYPFFSTGSDDRIIEKDINVVNAYNAFKKKHEKSTKNQREDLEIPITPLVTYGVSFYLKGDANGQRKFDMSAYRSSIRYDRLIVYFLFFSIIYISFSILISNNNDKEDSVIEVNKGVFDLDLEDSLRATEKMRSTSIVLLFSGILLAILGVIIFYTTMPSYSLFQMEKMTSLFLTLSILRPFGMLVFIESISWFLLRQYRNSMEDYKQLYRIYLKRKNYNLSYYIANNDHSNDFNKLLIDSLLKDDMTGILSEGQTTEFLESKKIIEDSNILEKINSLVKIIKK